MGLAILDAGVLIALLDPADSHHGAARDVLHTLHDRGDTIALPVSALSEFLVYPARAGEEAIAQANSFVSSLQVEVILLDREIAEAAARLRAKYGSRVRLPDALVIATAMVLEADRLITTDRRWPDDLEIPGVLDRL